MQFNQQVNRKVQGVCAWVWPRGRGRGCEVTHVQYLGALQITAAIIFSHGIN